MSNQFEIFEVGGAVRDSLLGIASNDVDFAVVCDSFADMRAELVARRFEIFIESPKFATIRARVPFRHPLRERTDVADFVLCRKDGPSSDGRRPDWTEPGTLADDLARRDFTVNAVARTVSGELVDPFGGVDDLKAGILRFVGDAGQRIREDGLRVLRGFRFQVTKSLTPTDETAQALVSLEAAEMLGCVSVERIREELAKMFAFDTLASLAMFARMPEHITRAVFRDGLKLAPTMKK